MFEKELLQVYRTNVNKTLNEPFLHYKELRTLYLSHNSKVAPQILINH